MNILNGIVGALIGGSLVWVLGRAYGEGVGAAKSLFVVGKKAGNEDIKLYIDHKMPNLACTGMSRCWMWHRCTRTRR